jgi:hypothetical protein
MKNLDLIKEEFIRLGDSPELVDLIKRSTAYFDEDRNNDFIERCPCAFVKVPENEDAFLLTKKRRCVLFQKIIYSAYYFPEINP